MKFRNQLIIAVILLTAIAVYLGLRNNTGIHFIENTKRRASNFWGVKYVKNKISRTPLKFLLKEKSSGDAGEYEFAGSTPTKRTDNRIVPLGQANPTRQSYQNSKSYSDAQNTLRTIEEINRINRLNQEQASRNRNPNQR